MSNKHIKVSRRDDVFSQRITTRIWQEQPNNDNPYLAQHQRCRGYDLLELMEKCSFVEVLYLLFRGELPTDKSHRLLEALMVAFINPGPRHPATRAAMTAGVGKTAPSHILPIALSIFSGNHLGAGEIDGAIRFIRTNRKKDPKLLAEELINTSPTSRSEEGDWHIAPGFGSHFGAIDPIPKQAASYLMSLADTDSCLAWGNNFATQLEVYNLGWLNTGVVAATLADLGFQPRAGVGLYQLLSAPGLLAHGLEMANKPITAMPFPDDNNYIIEND